MHCSGIWRLERENSVIAWQALTPKELEDVLPVLGPMADRFALVRRMVAVFPDYLERSDAARALARGMARPN